MPERFTHEPKPDDLSDIKEQLGLKADAPVQEVQEALKTQKRQERREARKQNPGEHKLTFQPVFIDAMTRTKGSGKAAIEALQDELIAELGNDEEIKGVQNQGHITKVELLDRRKNTGLSLAEQMELHDKTKMVRITFDSGQTEEVSIQEITNQYKIVTK